MQIYRNFTKKKVHFYNKPEYCQRTDIKLTIVYKSYKNKAIKTV